MMFGRGRFAELVGRQLDLFESEEAETLDEAATADREWSRASKEDAEERYGDYQLVVDALADRLLDIRESYAATLDDGTADEYRTAFGGAARKRFRAFAGLL
jgi:hypothetical protein